MTQKTVPRIQFHFSDFEPTLPLFKCKITGVSKLESVSLATFLRIPQKNLHKFAQRKKMAGSVFADKKLDILCQQTVMRGHGSAKKFEKMFEFKSSKNVRIFKFEKSFEFLSSKNRSNF
jgi:hypothetical protein